MKKCEYCHRYFIPFSSKALYCDRSVGDTGKSCKELAVKEKHEKKIAADDGLKLIRQRIKTYDMRVRRTPAIYTPKEERRIIDEENAKYLRIFLVLCVYCDIIKAR